MLVAELCEPDLVDENNVNEVESEESIIVFEPEEMDGENIETDVEDEAGES